MYAAAASRAFRRMRCAELSERMVRLPDEHMGGWGPRRTHMEASAMRCPVLRRRMAYARAMRCAEIRPVVPSTLKVASVLPPRYAMSGTEITYGTATPGTGIAYGTPCPRYAMSGTDIAYAATRPVHAVRYLHRLCCYQARYGGQKTARLRC
eukprot:3001597-Rhodomonas_salina.2